jgi:hypothetical protein
MSFSESKFSAGSIQKAVKVDLHVGINRAYPQWDGHQKDLEDTRGHHAEAERRRLSGGAGQPLGPTSQPHVVTSVLYRLKDCI